MECPSAGVIKIEDDNYFNQTILALFNVSPFVNWLHSVFDHYHKDCDRDTCLICSMSQLQRLTQSSTEPITSTSVYDKLPATFQRHGDPNDFLVYFFKQNVEGLGTPNKIFSGCFESVVTCKRCSVKLTTYQSFQQLKLKTNNEDTIEDALKRHFKESEACESCKTIGSTTKRLTVQAIPAVLWIQLEHDRTVVSHMSLANMIDLRNLFGDNSKVKATYRLISMITCYAGFSKRACYSTVRFAGGVYHDLVDSESGHLDLECITTGSPYILFYELEGNKSNGISVPTMLLPISSQMPSSLKYPLSSTLLSPMSSMIQSDMPSEILSTYSIRLSTTMASTLPKTP